MQLSYSISHPKYNDVFSTSNNEHIDNEQIFKVIDYEDELLTFSDAQRRARGYLEWIGAKYNPFTDEWDFSGNIICSKKNFLVYEGHLTVNFGNIDGYFVCCEMELRSLHGFPKQCYELHLSYNDIETIDWLPHASAYVLVSNNIKYINAEFSSYAWHIDLSHNNLTSLPNLRNNYLEYFDCSFNKGLYCLDGAPYAKHFNSNNCDLIRITSNENSLLFYDFCDFFDVSGNNLTSLKGVPPCKTLDASINGNLLSAEGIYESSTFAKEDDKAFEEIRLNSTGLRSLDHLPKSVFRVNLDYTYIETLDSNTTEMIANLYCHGCRRLENGDANGKIYINELYLDNISENLTDFSKFTRNVRKITFNTSNDQMKLHRDFFNSMNDDVPDYGKLNQYDHDYFLMFLNFLVDINHIRIGDTDQKEYLTTKFKWPNEFIPYLENFMNSKVAVKKFML